MEVRAVGKGVRSGEETTWDMDDLKIEVGKVEQPLCLMEVHMLGFCDL